LEFADHCADFRGNNPNPLQDAADDAGAFKGKLLDSLKKYTDWLGETGWLDRPKGK
jgi:hypothetical protein